MRNALIIGLLVAVAVICGGYMIRWYFQPPAVQPSSVTSAPQPAQN